MSPSDYLLAARDLIREKGWTRFSLENRSGELCLLGALNMSSCGRSCVIGSEGIPGGRGGARRALIAECSERYGTTLISTANNNHVRDADEACDILEAAAKRAAEGGL